MGGVKGTRYLLKIRNHAPRKAENSVPPLFFEKAGDNKTKGVNSESKKARVIILVPYTLSWPVIHFYQVS